MIGGAFAKVESEPIAHNWALFCLTIVRDLDKIGSLEASRTAVRHNQCGDKERSNERSKARKENNAA
jgi:hypothetical protein